MSSRLEYEAIGKGRKVAHKRKTNKTGRYVEEFLCILIALQAQSVAVLRLINQSFRVPGSRS